MKMLVLDMAVKPQNAGDQLAAAKTELATGYVSSVRFEEIAQLLMRQNTERTAAVGMLAAVIRDRRS